MSIEDEIKQTKPLRSCGEALILNVIRCADVLKSDMDAVLKPYDLSQSQFNILRICKGADGEGRTCSEISERLVSKVPDVTRLIDRMEKKGLVYRDRCTTDRRVVWIHISEKGAELIQQATEIINKNIDAITQHIGVDSSTETINVLESLRKYITEKENI
jgi:DNA-binding MarR family transcriptional regulator